MYIYNMCTPYNSKTYVAFRYSWNMFSNSVSQENHAWDTQSFTIEKLYKHDQSSPLYTHYACT